MAAQIDLFANSPRRHERKNNSVKDNLDFRLRFGGLDIFVQCPCFSGPVRSSYAGF
jgi:hypothetical protein